jgi:hypothetical protein
VVSSSSVDTNGNGTIVVDDENSSVTGSSTLQVQNWSVLGNAGSVSGWLHNPSLVKKIRDDYDGDGKSDPAKFIPSTGAVWWLSSKTGTWQGTWLGGDTFQYVGGSDFDGDGKTDPAKFYSATGTVWWVKSSDGKVEGTWLGPDSFQYVSASDFNGDGRTDPAKYDASTHRLSWLNVSTGIWTDIDMGTGTYTVVNGQ